MVIFVGVGGGSDLASCELLSIHMPSMGSTLITVMRPIIVSDVIDMPNTVLKYTGKPYMQGRTLQSARAEYAHYSFIDDPHDEVYFLHAMKPHIIGILMGTKEVFDASARVVKTIFESDPDGLMIAVDTGGDSLRSFVPGMGDQDISNVFDGTFDTRDADSLRLMCGLLSGPVRLYVLGPGADGETSQAGLEAASNWTSVQGSQCDSGNCRFVERIPVTSLLPLVHRVPQWSNPIPGSTIWNIRQALTEDPTSLISVIRRGIHVGTIQAKFLQECWVFDINCMQ